MFCAGSLAYHASRDLTAAPGTRAMGAMALVLLVAVMAANNRVPGSRFLPLYACVLAALPFVFLLTKESALDRWIGEFSYPFYLLHYLVLAHVENVYAAIFVTMAGAAIINWGVQDVAERAFKRRQRPAVIAA